MCDGANLATAGRRGGYCELMITGTGPVAGASEPMAAINLSAFLAAVRDQATLERDTRGTGGEVGEPVREPAADDGGRYAWTLQVNGQPVQILMPGVDLTNLRGPTSEAACLRINREWAWWSDAVYLAVPLPRKAAPAS
jgi:hypothetical protein